MSRAAAWLPLALALLLLNALLALGPGHTGPWPQFTPRVSLELCGALAALALWVRWRGPASARLLRALAALTAAAIALQLLNLVAEGFFGRPLHLYWDGRHLQQVWRLAELPLWQLVLGSALLAGVLVCVLAALAALALLGWRTMGQGLRVPRQALAVLALCLLLLAARAGNGLGGLESWRWFSPPVTPLLWRQAQLGLALWQRDAAATRLAPSPVFGANLGALRGADVLLVFSESYGACTLDQPEQAQALAPDRAALAQALALSGRGVVSARLRSPTFGGGSWLAHGALLSGIDTRDPLDYDLLLSTRRPTLAQHFSQHGYRTVHWAPGLQRPWPEGQFFGFDHYVDAPRMGYQGLPFGPWRIPDQAALALLHAQLLSQPRSARAPRFVFFPTINSHAPFHPLPPLAIDWARLTGPQAYSAQAQAHALESVQTWRDSVPAYLQAMRGSWQWLGAYLRDLAPPDLLVIWVGDHQPWAQVSGHNASWDVPIHVISADRDLLRRFETAGFTPGLLPAAPAWGEMHQLTGLLSTLFATER